MKFTSHPSQPSHANQQAVKNHFGLRGAGGRLIFLVAMLVLVLVAMQRASQPETWSWMFGDVETDQADGPESSSSAQPADTASSGGVVEFRSPTTEFGAESRKAQKTTPPNSQKSNVPKNSIVGTAADNHLVETLRTEFWRDAIDALDARSQLELMSLVKATAEQKPLSEGKTAAVSQIFAKIDKRRQQLHVKLLEQVSSSDRANDQHNVSLSQALAKLQQIWTADIMPAVRAILNEAVSNDLANDTVTKLPQLIDRAATQLVRDHTQVGRKPESYAWFSAWDKVFNAPIQSDLQNLVTITSLLAQPSAYRGQTVSIAGEVLQVDEVPAGPNHLGIDQYFVAWIKPDHVSTVPFCLYTLMLPDAYIDSTEDSNDGVPIRCNARFFKVRLYNSNGPTQAPLLMAASFEVVPPDEMASLPRRWMPDWASSVPIMLLIVAMAIYLTWRIYSATTNIRPRKQKSAAVLEKNFEQLEDDPNVVSISDKLGRMAQEESAANTD